MSVFSRKVPPMTPENTRVIPGPPRPASAHRSEILENYERAADAETRATALLRIAQINEQAATDTLVEAQEARKVAASRLRAVAEGRV